MHVHPRELPDPQVPADCSVELLAPGASTTSYAGAGCTGFDPLTAHYLPAPAAAAAHLPARATTMEASR